MSSETSSLDLVVSAAKKLARTVDRLQFREPVTHVYNPLHYAWPAHEQYLRYLEPSRCEVFFLGMNPGPWGMAQTGIPFGQVETVREWLKIDAMIRQPKCEHPKRPVQGLQCPRSEVSGERLWGLFRRRYKTRQAFFTKHFVANYCPLVFMEASGKNRTPDKLPADEREPLVTACDEHLRTLIQIMEPKWVVGVGAYAEKCLERVVGEEVTVTRILHPSPASPAANRGWGEAATEQLVAAGVWAE